MKNQARLTVPIVSHLGAVVDFVAGRVRRAPFWMQLAGMEWLWRIKEAPSLWQRYFKDGLVFLWLLATRVTPYAWFMRKHKPLQRDIDLASIELQNDGARYAYASVAHGCRKTCFH